MAMTSRYPSPGEFTSAIWESSDLKALNALVVVMATSRHKRSITEEQALALLQKEYGPEARIDRIGTWRSVTKYDEENGVFGSIDEVEAGGWCEGASGAATVTVAYPTKAAVDAW